MNNANKVGKLCARVLGIAGTLAMVPGVVSHVSAQNAMVQTRATGSDAAEAKVSRIVIRNGKAFLLDVIGAPDGLPLDTSETPLPLKVFSTEKTPRVISRCVRITNEGPKSVDLKVAARPKDAAKIFVPPIPSTLANGASVTICPPEEAVKRVAHVLVSTEVTRGNVTTVEQSEVISFTAAAPDEDRIIAMERVASAATPGGLVYEALVQLDGTGISDWRFLNPRRMHRVCVFALLPAACSDVETDAPVDLVFDNTMTDRVLIATFTGIPVSQRGAFLEVEAGMKVSCSDGTCTASSQLPRGRTRIPVRVLHRAYSQGILGKPVQFTVAKFVEDVPLSNNRGYFTVVAVANTRELPSSSSWSFIGQAAAMYEPDLSGLFEPCAKEEKDCAKTARITTVRTLDGQQRTHVNGTARLGFTQSLGARADADVELQIKKGDLGGDAATVEVTPTKYRLNINASNGSIISGGRYTFADPSQSIAISESGEGLSVRYKYFEIGHLFKHETGQARVQRLIGDAVDDDPDNDRDLEDGDHSTTIVQFREVATPGGHFRLNAIGLYGQSRPLGVRSNYWTGGGDATYLLPSINAMQTLSVYHSRRDSSAPLKDGTDKASGTAWLLTSSYTNFDRSAATEDSHPNDFTVGLLVGRGTGDKAGSATEREDYLGETAGFSPDLIFLNSLAGAFGIDGATEGRVGEGLSNKLYVGASFDTPKYSLLKWVARALRTDEDVEKESIGTTLRYHWYRLNEPVLGEHFAGQEVDVDFRIESPAKVKYTFSLGMYFPGAAIKPMVTQMQWKVAGNLSVKM